MVPVNNRTILVHHIVSHRSRKAAQVFFTLLLATIFVFLFQRSKLSWKFWSLGCRCNAGAVGAGVQGTQSQGEERKRREAMPLLDELEASGATAFCCFVLRSTRSTCLPSQSKVSKNSKISMVFFHTLAYHIMIYHRCMIHNIR